MKAILVIDMPESCEECCCAYYTEGISHNYCQAVGYETYIDGYKNKPSLFDKKYKGKKPDWCPLKPIPEKVETPKIIQEQIDGWHKLAGEYIGYNACIDEILGEDK